MLALAGAFVGLAGGFALGWLAWLEYYGVWGRVLAGVGAVCYLVALFLACRRGAGGLGGRWGALGAAAGWILGTLLISTYAPGGDVVITDSIVNYLWVYGGMVTVVAGALTVRESGADSSRALRGGRGGVLNV